MTSKLVSIIIPCFNAERWLREAINSALNQSYSQTEVIVINDGSTDRSLDIIKSYGNKIIWESWHNKGGNHARNRGISLSNGNFLQFLDADDYILPKKLETQVSFLDTTEADVVYGDWRHQYHLPNGDFYLGELQISGEQTDILQSLLEDWWVSPACLLFRRTIVEATNGWDERLRAGQDRDFLLSVVLNGAHIAYQPGCYSIYRRYGNVTVSTSSKARYLENHCMILEKFERSLIEQENFSVKYQHAIAQSYFLIARGYLNIEPALYAKYLKKVSTLCPNFQAKSSDRTAIYNLFQKIFGFWKLEKLTFLAKRINFLFKIESDKINTLTSKFFENI